MKTLILNGSPRKNGNTVSLINILSSSLKGECKIIDTYYANISPCLDCRFCHKNQGCAITDEMYEIYKYIENCDNIVVASPIYFTQLTGKLLDFCSRFQTYFSATNFRKNPVKIKPKKGAVILVGAGKGDPLTAYYTATCILHQINTFDIHPLALSFNTDVLPAIEDQNTLNQIQNISNFFNS